MLEAARAAYIVVDALLDAAALGPRALAVAIGDGSVLARLSGGPRPFRRACAIGSSPPGVRSSRTERTLLGLWR